MKIYIAYKFSNVKDKNSLKKDLLKVSDILESFGHNTFILGRDVQNWDNTSHPIHSKIKKMVTEIKNSDGLFIYISNSSISWGLTFEVIVAKLLRKKLILSIKDGYKATFYSLFASNILKFTNIDDLKEQLS